MKNLNNYIIEKLRINKDTDRKENWSNRKKEIKKMFEDEESKMTLKFLLNFIRRSKSEPYKNSIFNYWEMGINKNVLSCQHSGWSHGNFGWQKSKYIKTVIDNYNKDNGTNIDVNIAGALNSDYAGIPILYIEEVVDEFKKKYPDFEPDTEKELVSVDYE